MGFPTIFRGGLLVLGSVCCPMMPWFFQKKSRNSIFFAEGLKGVWFALDLRRHSTPWTWSFNPGLYFNSWSEPIFSASVYRHGDVSATWIGIHRIPCFWASLKYSFWACFFPKILKFYENMGGVEPKIEVNPQNGWWKSWKTLWTNGRFGGTINFGNTHGVYSLHILALSWKSHDENLLLMVQKSGLTSWYASFSHYLQGFIHVDGGISEVCCGDFVSGDPGQALFGKSQKCLILSMYKYLEFWMKFVAWKKTQVMVTTPFCCLSFCFSRV